MTALPRTMLALARLMLVLLAAAPWSAARALDVGDTAPAWRLVDDRERPVDLIQATADAPAVLFFWATWCPYCRSLMPHLDAVRQDFAGRGVRFLALNVWEDGDARAYLHDNHYDFELLPMAEKVADAYGVQGTPGLFIIDRTRRIVYRRARGTPDRDAALAVRETLERVFGGE